MGAEKAAGENSTPHHISGRGQEIWVLDWAKMEDQKLAGSLAGGWFERSMLNFNVVCLNAPNFSVSFT